MVAKFLFLVTGIISVITIGDCKLLTCPPNDLTESCECIHLFGNVFLKCNGVTDYRQLQKTKEEMQGYEITVFELKNSNMKHIPYDFFSNFSVSRVNILNTTLFYLFDMPLKGEVEKSLEEIKLSNISFTSGFDWSILSNLVNLRQLAVIDSDLEQLYAGLELISLPIEALILSNDNIKFVYGKALSGFEKLKVLKINNNQLKNINRKIFSYPTCGIQFLDLSYNKLKALPTDMFEGMPSLHSVLLDGNMFTFFDRTYMDKVWNKLFFFAARNNPLLCDCSIAWMLEDDSRPYHLYAECTEPPHLNGFSIADLQKNDLESC